MKFDEAISRIRNILSLPYSYDYVNIDEYIQLYTDIVQDKITKCDFTNFTRNIGHERIIKLLKIYVVAISKNKTLKHLIIRERNIKDSHLRLLQRCKSITTLDVAYSNIGNKGIRYISNMPNLESLNISNNNFTCNMLLELDKLEHLRILYIDSRKYTPIFSPNSKFTDLYVTDYSLHNFDIDFNNLSYLPIRKITKYNHKNLVNFQHIEKLHATLTDLTIWINHSIDYYIPISKLTNLQKLSLSAINSTYSIDIDCISLLPTSITALCIYYKFSSQSFNFLVSRLVNLEKLMINRYINDDYLTNISNLTKLKYLKIGGSVSNIGLNNIAKLPLLEILHIQSSNIDDITVLAEMPMLTQLQLYSISLANFDALRNIKSLCRLQIGAIDNITNIINMPALTNLRFSDTYKPEHIHILNMPTLQRYHNIMTNSKNPNMNLNIIDQVYNPELQYIDNITHPTLIRNIHNNTIRNTPFYDLVL